MWKIEGREEGGLSGAAARTGFLRNKQAENV